MYLQKLIPEAFGPLPDQQIDLGKGLNILVDTAGLYSGLLSSFVVATLYGLPADARTRLLDAEDRASGEVTLVDGVRSFRLRTDFSRDGETVRVEVSSAAGLDDRVARTGGAATGQRSQGSLARAQAATSDRQAAAADPSSSSSPDARSTPSQTGSDTRSASSQAGPDPPLTPIQAGPGGRLPLPQTAPDARLAFAQTGWLVTDLQADYDKQLKDLADERQAVSGLLDVVNIRLLQERAIRARQLVSEMEKLEKQVRSDPVADRAFGDDVVSAKSLDSHIASLNKVIAMKEAKLRDMREQLESRRGKLDFYEYLNGMGINEINTVKRSLERKRWLVDDLQKLEMEIELGSKRLDTVATMVRKYDRLAPFVGQREMELDHLEDQLEQLKSRMPTQKLQQIEAERRGLRLQIEYWRRRRTIAIVASLVPLPSAFLWLPIALLSLVGGVFVFKYWQEVTTLVRRMAEIADRHDYLVLERNTIAAQIRTTQADIDAIHNQTGTQSASELHDKIQDYQRLSAELQDLKRKAAERERARDELKRRLREEEQRAGVLFDRVGLSAGLDPESVEQFANMISDRISEERSLKDLERRIEDEQSETDGLARQVGVLQKRLSRILAARGVESLTQLEELWSTSDAHGIRKQYDAKAEELRQLLNGQRLPDLEARIEMLSQLVPEYNRVEELPLGVTVDQLEARLEAIRVRADLLKWLRGTTFPVIIEAVGGEEMEELEKRQACVDLCWMARSRQLLVLVQSEAWAAAMRSVADDLGVPVKTVVLGAAV
jgi:hypothetical protein